MKQFFLTVLSLSLSALLIFSPLLNAIGQEGSIAIPSVPSVDTGRVKGTSFGTKKEKGVTTTLLPVTSQTSIFQEQAYGGLTYQVHILGEVNKPGTYRVIASTRLSEVLESAGGILERGSERRIELRRKEGGGRRVDLLSFKFFGNLDANPYLLDNDIIFVPLRNKVVQIEGTVKRPGTYELTRERTLEDVIKLAGGFTSGVNNPAPIKVIRFNHGTKEIIDVENVEETRKKFRLENADAIVVPHFLTQQKTFDYNLPHLPGDNPLFYPSYDERVFILGAVAKPGPYPFSPFYNFRQYLTIAGGVTKLGKSRGIQVLKANGETVKVNTKVEINPGDTIIVPEKYLPPESLLTLVLGIATSILGITTTVLTLTQ